MERRAIAVWGTVQGVGFRPHVHRLASQLKLHGSVRNTGGGVSIEVEGETAQLEEFLKHLRRDPPPLAQIEECTWELRPSRGDTGFLIENSSVEGTGDIAIAPDVAVCDACLAEMWDPENRRYRYPFLNCTNCGPRLTIVTGIPYDRARTTMADFIMCAACRAEYDDPEDRRFHAQPVACPNCGPRLVAADAQGNSVAVEDPLRWFVELLREGNIGAMKGLGGYHLVCDARRAETVAALRRRKPMRQPRT